MDTEDISECALSEQFERFHMTMVGDPCLTAMQEGDENSNIGCCSVSYL